MAVHLNARLNTRFIPVLFTLAVLLSLGATLVHASTDGVASPDDAQALTVAPPDEAAELRAVMDESVDPSRIDRRPGFSTVIVAPQLNARKDEEPARQDVSDRLSVQPQEAQPDQR
jgi:hypothetical protein